MGILIKQLPPIMHPNQDVGLGYHTIYALHNLNAASQVLALYVSIWSLDDLRKVISVPLWSLFLRRHLKGYFCTPLKAVLDGF